jgi:hypothetical protein
MKILLRGLAAAAVLAVSLYMPKTTEAACGPISGSCSASCEPCFTRADCGLDNNGVQQACICNWQCP